MKSSTAGASTIIAVDGNAHRLEIVRSLGADQRDGVLKVAIKPY